MVRRAEKGLFTLAVLLLLVGGSACSTARSPAADAGSTRSPAADAGSTRSPAADAGSTERIFAVDAGSQCEASCGTSLPVETALAPATALTAEECARVCAANWCGRSPIRKPGCTLTDSHTVSCIATVWDCGHCFYTCGAGCGGCCNADLCCQATVRSCRALSCDACPPIDARCSLSACRTFKACGGQLVAEPNPVVCDGAPDQPDASVELAEFCPDACNAQQAGAVLELGCPADAGSSAPDAGLPDGGTCACAATRVSCEAACSRTTKRDCLECAADCAIDAYRCLQACQ
jgi:hypothetical protein